MEDSVMSREDQERIGLLAGRAFSPGSPIKDKEVFAGRKPQIRQVIDAINQDGRSVLIYGERGVGKTSLANVIDDYYLSIADARIFAPHIMCDAEDDFNTVWMKVLDERYRQRPTAGLSETVLAEVDQIVADAGGVLTPHSIRQVAETITQTHLLIPIIDEFDRINDPYALSLFTDTIKTLSDHALNTTVLLVGVGDTVDELVSEHGSVERALVQVLMPRMTAKESLQILHHGKDVTGVRFSDDAASLLISIAQGLPHYIHLLGLNSTRVAVDAGSWMIEERHVETATSEAIEGSQQSLLRAYHSATSSPRPESLHKQVLLGCAMARTDELGYFAPADVRAPMSRIMGKPYDIPSFSQHLTQFCSEDRGGVLQRIGSSRKFRYRFTNPLLQPFVVMRGLNDRSISNEDIRGLFSLGRQEDL